MNTRYGAGNRTKTKVTACKSPSLPPKTVRANIFLHFFVLLLTKAHAYDTMVYGLNEFRLQTVRSMLKRKIYLKSKHRFGCPSRVKIEDVILYAGVAELADA